MTRYRSVFAVQATLVLALVLAQGGCKKSQNADQASMSTESAAPAPPQGTMGSSGAENAVTAQDQSQNPSDLALVKAIRQELVDDKALSMSAQNIKVVAADGQVTLRGQVKSPREKDEIATKVKKVAGVKKVDNQLETETAQ